MSADAYKYWGLSELKIDSDLLTSGRFGLRCARGCFSDGTAFAMPDRDPLPTPLEIDPQLRNQVISLSLPLGAIEAIGGHHQMSTPQSGLHGRKAVYLLSSAEKFHAAAGQPSNPAETKSTEAFTQIQLAQLIECRPDKSVVLDDRFIPTVIRCGAAARLQDFLWELLALIRVRADALATRLISDPHGAAIEPLKVMMLQSLNRYDPVVTQLAATADCHPEDLHRLALGIVGELATFTSASRRSVQFPIYRHDALRASFDPVIQALRASLSVMLEQTAISIPLEQKRFGISIGKVNDRTLFDSAVFVLAARADVPGEDFRHRFPRQVKIGPVEQIPNLVNFQLPGVNIEAMPVAPRPIPQHPGFSYFELGRGSEMWRALKASAGIGIHQGGEFPALSMELWAVRNEESAQLARGSLTLEVISPPGELASSPDGRHTFGPTGGKIGRSRDCDWVLPSPYISRHHATIRCIQGTYYIEGALDGSVAVNDRQAMLPTLQPRALEDGDRLFLDEFEIKVSLGRPRAPGAAPPAARSAPPPTRSVPDDWSGASFGVAEAAPGPSAAVPRVDQNLQFTVYRPRQLVPQLWLPLLAFAHLSDRPGDADPSQPHPVEEVAEQAEALLSQRIQEYRPIVQPAGQAVMRDSELTFLPSVDGLDFDPPQHAFVWKGSVHRAVFLVRAHEKLIGRTLRGKLSVFLGSLVIAEVPLSIPIAAEAHGETGGQPVVAESARRYRKIFASYSRKDESIVEECERYARVLGDEYMRDVVTLRAGEVWDKRLQSLIADADVFQLFWSWNSMDSPFVRAEWEHALELGRPEFVRPLYWEDPLPCRPDVDLPPPALQSVHFQRLPARKTSSGVTAFSAARAISAPNPDAIGIGRILGGRFLLEEEIDRDEVSVTFKALDLHQQQTQDRGSRVAVRVVKEASGAQRDWQESRKTPTLAHPNIVTVQAAGLDGGSAYWVTELLEGESLDRLMNRVRGVGLEAKQALHIAQEICGALTYAHESGVVHAGLKPGSVFLTGQGSVKILNLGLAPTARRRQGTASSGKRSGLEALGASAQAYASSEVIEGEAAEVRDDVYSIACILYEMLTGAHPFESAIHGHRLARALKRPAGLSRAQWRTLERGLAFRREHRPKSAREFARGLERGRMRRLGDLLFGTRQLGNAK